MSRVLDVVNVVKIPVETILPFTLMVGVIALAVVFTHFLSITFLEE